MKNQKKIKKSFTSLLACQLIGNVVKSTVEELSEEIQQMSDGEEKIRRVLQLAYDTDSALRYVHNNTDSLIKIVDRSL